MFRRRPLFRLSVPAVLIALGAAACGGSSTPEATTTGEGAATTTTVSGLLAPDFSLDLADGTTFTLSAEQKPVYLVFWAEWCPICAGELPVIDEIAADYLDEVTFLAVAGKSDPTLAAERAGQLFSDNLAWGLGDAIWDLYGIIGQPDTVIVSGDDVIVDQWYGTLPESAIRERLDAALAVSG